ncbi:MAG: proline iminopeptidase-family hydrolase [Gammaproteobacteria bacterium]|nr:proline iminopeptidase-family hydrolase [Gammaproteobacteria bacterium]
MKRICVAALLLSFCSIGICRDGPEPGQGFIDVPGGPIWYKITGNGPGIPVLALHGGPGGTSCDFALLEPLGDQRPIIRYDQLGTGRSGRPDDVSLWTVERFVEELHVLRQKLGLKQLHLLGHSWGASLAAAYVLEKGTDGIASVIFSSPLLSTPLWVADANIQRSQLPEDVQQTLAEHEKAGTTDSDEYEAASEVYYERHMYAGKRPETLAACKGAPWSQFVYEYMWGPQEFYATGTLVNFDVTDRLHEIDVPVLFMTGQFDEARPETVAGFQQLIPGSQFTVIEDAGHASLSKHPQEYRTILENFLESVESKKD